MPPAEIPLSGINQWSPNVQQHVWESAHLLEDETEGRGPPDAQAVERGPESHNDQAERTRMDYPRESSRGDIKKTRWSPSQLAGEPI
jgi:hypothetical protein